MNDNNQTNLDKIKKHLHTYKEYYITSALVIGCGIGCYILGKNNGSVRISDMSEARETIINNGHDISNNITYNMQGKLSKIVRCIETGELWTSIQEAADDFGVNRVTMSKAANGRTGDIQGLHFEIVGFGSCS